MLNYCNIVKKGKDILLLIGVFFISILGIFIFSQTQAYAACCMCGSGDEAECLCGNHTCEYLCAIGSSISCGDADDEYDDEDEVTRCNCGGDVCRQVSGRHSCSSYVCRGGSSVGDECPADDSTDSTNGGGVSGDVVHLQSPINIDSPTELAATFIRFNTMAIGLFAVAAMIYTGILYFTSGGNEEQAGKAKKTITYAILGLIVAILSYVIINTLINSIGG